MVQEAIDKYAFQPYTAKTGIKVVQGTFGDENEIITKIKTSKPGDFQIIHSSGVNTTSNTSMAASTRRSTRPTFPTWRMCCTAMIEPFRKITPKLSAVPYDYGTTGIAYNTTVISPRGSQGKGRQLCSSTRNTQARSAAMATWRRGSGTRRCRPARTPTTSRTWMRSGPRSARRRDLAKKFWSSGAELMDLLSKGEIVVTDAWSGRIAALQQQGHPIGYLDPPAPTPGWRTCWC